MCYRLTIAVKNFKGWLIDDVAANLWQLLPYVILLISIWQAAKKSNRDILFFGQICLIFGTLFPLV
jgi:hypothetical protein